MSLEKDERHFDHAKWIRADVNTNQEWPYIDIAVQFNDGKEGLAHYRGMRNFLLKNPVIEHGRERNNSVIFNQDMHRIHITGSENYHRFVGWLRNHNVDGRNDRIIATIASPQMQEYLHTKYEQHRQKMARQIPLDLGDAAKPEYHVSQYAEPQKPKLPLEKRLPQYTSEIKAERKRGHFGMQPVDGPLSRK